MSAETAPTEHDYAILDDTGRVIDYAHGERTAQSTADHWTRRVRRTHTVAALAG